MLTTLLHVLKSQPQQDELLTVRRLADLVNQAMQANMYAGLKNEVYLDQLTAELTDPNG